jgi:hypothetical protein
MRGRRRIELAAQLLGAFARGELAFTSANSHWKTAKQQLKRESHGKCAYCEAPTTSVAHGDVEHFRPKARYWWLAYCYDNYLFACQICNQQYKSDNFPFSGAAMRPTRLPSRVALAAMDETALAKLAARLAPDPLGDTEGQPAAKFIAATEREQAHLVDPYTTDPEPLFRWEADAELQEVRLAARDETPRAMEACAAAEEVLGLNREELLRERWRVYQNLELYRQTLEVPRLPAELRAKVRAMLRAMTADDAPFAGMARYFVRDEWRLDLQD